MAFPSQHAYPTELRGWLLAGHELRAGDRAVLIPFEQGEDRHREMYGFTPWTAAVSSALLTHDEFTRFAEWFDNDLQGGVQKFDTQVSGLNGALAQ